jgi:hypothetical protein
MKNIDEYIKDLEKGVFRGDDSNEQLSQRIKEGIKAQPLSELTEQQKKERWTPEIRISMPKHLVPNELRDLGP